MVVFAARALRLLLAAFLAVWLGLAADADAPIEIGDRFCTLAGVGGISPEDALARRADFDCGPERLNKATNHLWLVADVDDLSETLLDPHLTTRMSHHREILLHVAYDDGSTATRFYDLEALERQWRAPGSLRFSLDWPGEGAERGIETILIGVNHPWDPTNWADMELYAGDSAARSHLIHVILAALFSGVLFAPLLLNIVFFTVVRHRFLLFHSLMVACVQTYAVSWSGLVFVLAPGVDFVERSMFNHYVLAVAALAGCLLTRELCEEGTLGRRSKAALAASAGIPLAVALVIVERSPAMPLVGSEIYHAAFLAPLIAIIVCLIIAARRGSIMARFQLVGWIGLFPLAAGRVIRGLGITTDSAWLDVGFFPALAFEAVVASLAVAYRISMLRREHEQALIERGRLRRIAETDDLTGIPNRRAFIDRFETQMARSDRRGQVCALLILDIDHFKNVNDTFGHDAGDIALTQLAHMLEETRREQDFCARFGGEEFVFLVNAPTPKDATACAERLRREAATMRYGDANRDLGQITVSIGVAHIVPDYGLGFHDYYAMADAALYRAKQSGRNRVCVADPPEPSQSAVAASAASGDGASQRA